MSKSGPTPIEFNAKLYYIGGALAALLAVSSVYFAVNSRSYVGVIPAVVFAVVSFLSFRAARDAPR